MSLACTFSDVMMRLHDMTYNLTYRELSQTFSNLIYVYQLLIYCHFFVFFSLRILSWSMINSLILGCLWPLVFILNNILTLDIWRSAISHLPGCFCPWTFVQNIGFNMVPSAPFMSQLATQLVYSAGEFQALQLFVLAAFGVVDYN